MSIAAPIATEIEADLPRATGREVEADVDVVEYGSRRILVVIAVMLATLLETLDSTIVNVALLRGSRFG